MILICHIAYIYKFLKNFTTLTQHKSFPSWCHTREKWIACQYGTETCILNCLLIKCHLKVLFFLLNSYLQLSVWRSYLSLDSKIAEQIYIVCLLLLTNWGQSLRVLLRHPHPHPLSIFQLLPFCIPIQLYTLNFSRLLEVSSVHLVAEWNIQLHCVKRNRTMFPKTIARPWR